MHSLSWHHDCIVQGDIYWRLGYAALGTMLPGALRSLFWNIFEFCTQEDNDLQNQPVLFRYRDRRFIWIHAFKDAGANQDPSCSEKNGFFYWNPSFLYKMPRSTELQDCHTAFLLFFPLPRATGKKNLLSLFSQVSTWFGTFRAISETPLVCARKSLFNTHSWVEDSFEMLISIYCIKKIFNAQRRCLT